MVNFEGRQQQNEFHSFLLQTCDFKFSNLLSKCKKSQVTLSSELSESSSVISLFSVKKTVIKILESTSALLVDGLSSSSSEVNTSLRVNLQRIMYSEKLGKQHQTRPKLRAIATLQLTGSKCRQ